MIYIGIDNGVSGSIGMRCSHDDRIYWWKTPTKHHLKYTKKKSFVNRIDIEKLRNIFSKYIGEIRVILERPMINPKFFHASMSAMRAWEATLIAIELEHISYEYIDSKEWQKYMLPAGLKGKELKEASTQVAHRLFPNLKFTGDGDGILISEYARRRDLGLIK